MDDDFDTKYRRQEAGFTDKKTGIKTYSERLNDDDFIKRRIKLTGVKDIASAVLKSPIGRRLGLGAATAVGAGVLTKKYFEKNDSKNRDRLTDRDLKKVSELTKRLKEADIRETDIQGSVAPYVKGMMEGGSVRGQKPIQVKKKVFKGIF